MSKLTKFCNLQNHGRDAYGRECTVYLRQDGNLTFDREEAKSLVCGQNVVECNYSAESAKKKCDRYMDLPEKKGDSQ